MLRSRLARIPVAVLVIALGAQMGCKDRAARPTAASQHIESRTAQGPMIVAHRGGRNLGAENTLAAISATLALDLDVVEVDLSRSAEGTPVLMHVADLAKATDARTVFPGRRNYSIDTFTVAMLKRLHVQPWSKTTRKLSPQPVALFADAMKKLGPSALVVVDNKSATAEQMVHALRDAGAITNVIVQSARPKFLREVRAIEPRLVTAALGNTKMTPPRLQGLHNAGVSVLHWHLRALSRKAVVRFQQQGFFVGAYAISTAAQMKTATAYGVDFITTDFPERALAERVKGELRYLPKTREHIDSAARAAFARRALAPRPAPDAGVVKPVAATH